MKVIVHYIGLDVHKETIAVAIAPPGTTEVRIYGIIGGTLEALDKLIRKLSTKNVELRFVYEAGLAASSSTATSKAKASIARWSALPSFPKGLPPPGRRATGPVVSGQ